MRDRAFKNGKTKRLNDRSVGVLSGRQDCAIALPRRLRSMTIIRTVLRAIGVFMSLEASGMMLGSGGKLLEEMVHPMGRGGDQKNPKSGGNAKVQTAVDFRKSSLGHHRSYLSKTAFTAQAARRRTASFNSELNLVAGVQLGCVVRCDDAQLQDMFAGLDAVERAFFAFEHAHEFAVDVGVRVVAAFTLGEFILDRHFVAL